VEKEIHSKLSMGLQLTEPFVARMVMETLSPGSALFLGNSMPIRDADMYATSSSPGKSLSSGSSIQGLEGRVGCNRGASGIDGVLSSAIGFAVGCNQRVQQICSLN
jgi:isochorismate synthase/2-succinyl-5-enolpyruvyl-6-hydroxy-3-cyclohexene-1-carboxylate synthase/2-succinyl-6-hydroxy-2,4-cyclohexadiene-1-carboxylate synthase/O-succinylbenzoate synthase